MERQLFEREDVGSRDPHLANFFLRGPNAGHTLERTCRIMSSAANLAIVR
jgi:hypothetical protein